MLIAFSGTLKDPDGANSDEEYTEVKLNRFAELVKKICAQSNGDVKEYLSEIEVLRREKEKLNLYIYSKRSNHKGI